VPMSRSFAWASHASLLLDSLVKGVREGEDLPLMKIYVKPFLRCAHISPFFIRVTLMLQKEGHGH